MKKRKQIQSLRLKKSSVVNLTNKTIVKGGLADFTGDSCFEVCNTDLRECTWRAE